MVTLLKIIISQVQSPGRCPRFCIGEAPVLAACGPGWGGGGGANGRVAVGWTKDGRGVGGASRDIPASAVTQHPPPRLPQRICPNGPKNLDLVIF